MTAYPWAETLEVVGVSHGPVVVSIYSLLMFTVTCNKLAGRRTNGTPQYVHQQICGLSTLMKILGCPSGPPPPSQDTVRPWVQRTGCLWMSSMAAYGRGYHSTLAITTFSSSTFNLPDDDIINIPGPP